MNLDEVRWSLVCDESIRWRTWWSSHICNLPSRGRGVNGVLCQHDIDFGILWITACACPRTYSDLQDLHDAAPGWSWMILKCRRPSVIPKVPALLWALQVCVCLDDRAISRNWRSQVWLLLGLWLGARSGSEPSEPVISRFFTTLWDLCHNLCHNLCHILSQDTGWKWPGPNI